MSDLAELPDLISLRADTPLRLWREEGAWRVVEGYVDLFATPIGEDGEGRRSFLLRLAQGEHFFALPPGQAGGEEVGVVVVGGLEGCVQAVANVDARDADHWAGRLAAALGDKPAGVDRLVAEGRDSVLAGESIGASSQRPVWCRVLSGRLALLDDDAFSMDGGHPPFLLAASLPAMAREDCEIEARQATGLAAGELDEALGQWHRLAGLLAARLVVQRREQQAELARRRRQVSQAALRTGLSEIAAAVGQGEGLVALPAPVAGDPLLAVLRRVGERIGVGFREPTSEDAVRDEGGGGRLDTLLAVSAVRSRSVLLRDKWWRQDNGALVGWRQDSRAPVALLPVRGGYDCWDPATGESRPVDESLAASLAADATMIYAKLPDRAIQAGDLVRLGLRGAFRDLGLFAALALGAALLGLLVPVATGVLVDAIIPSAERGQLAVLVGGLLAAAMCAASFELVKGLLLLRVEGRLDASLQAAFFDRLLRLPATFFRTFTAGDLSDRVLGVQAIRQMLAGSTITTLLGGIFSSVSLILLFAYDARLALVAVGLTAVSLTVTTGFTLLQLKHERAQALHRGGVEGLVLQLVTGEAKLKVSAAQDRAIGAWARRFAVQKARFVAAQTVAAWQGVFQAFFPPLATVVVFLAVTWLARDAAAQAELKALTGAGGEEAGGALGAGAFLAFQAAFGQFLGSLTQVVQSITASLGALPLYERAKPILDAEPENAADRPSPGTLDGAIEFSGVGFSYQADGPEILKDLSFAVRPGEFVALVGPSGSGKSTVLRLLLGLEPPNAGEIFFDGKPVSRLNLDALRAQVAVVMQNGRILPGSILSNILGSHGGSLDDAWEAARQVGLDTDIRNMPMGMHTVLTEGAGTLSGGQRQRLMIARALVRKPRVLLLDEATSALDNRTQAIVTESLAALNITRLVIAHRLSTIEAVDRVMVLDKGQLVQCGSFAELREAPGLFQDLARRQTL